LADAISRVLPTGVSTFVKAGSIDVPGFHCVCLPGGCSLTVGGSTSPPQSIGMQPAKPTQTP
jgi:hypothetical protein